MNIEFNKIAIEELKIATDYYDQCREGLGLEFATEVQKTIQAISNYPKAWPIIDGDIRKCNLQKFPFGILYSIESDNCILIIAIMHLHQKPGYWKNRF